MAPVGRVGRCATCAAFTYDAHELSEEELRRLVLETEGRVLTTLVRRTDGRVMSVDCGHGTIRTGPRSNSRKVMMLVGAVAVLALGARLLWPRPVMDDQHDQSIDGVEVPTPVPPEPVAPIVDVPPPAAVPAPSRVFMVTVPEPQLRPPPGPFSDVLAVDVHLGDVTHTWDRLVVQTNQVVEALESQLEPVRACYRTTLETSRTYRGVFTTRLFVERDGHVSRASLSSTNRQSTNQALERCLEASMKAMEFPLWGSGQVAFRVVFSGAL